MLVSIVPSFFSGTSPHQGMSTFEQSCASLNCAPKMRVLSSSFATSKQPSLCFCRCGEPRKGCRSDFGECHLTKIMGQPIAQCPVVIPDTWMDRHPSGFVNQQAPRPSSYTDVKVHLVCRNNLVDSWLFK